MNKIEVAFCQKFRPTKIEFYSVNVKEGKTEKQNTFLFILCNVKEGPYNVGQNPIIEIEQKKIQ